MTLVQLLQKLRNTEETIVLELLDLKSDDLVDAFYDRVAERYSYIADMFEDDEDN